MIGVEEMVEELIKHIMDIFGCNRKEAINEIEKWL